MLGWVSAGGREQFKPASGGRFVFCCLRAVCCALGFSSAELSAEEREWACRPRQPCGAFPLGPSQLEIVPMGSIPSTNLPLELQWLQNSWCYYDALKFSVLDIHLPWSEGINVISYSSQRQEPRVSRWEGGVENRIILLQYFHSQLRSLGKAVLLVVHLISCNWLHLFLLLTTALSVQAFFAGWNKKATRRIQKVAFMHSRLAGHCSCFRECAVMSWSSYICYANCQLGWYGMQSNLFLGLLAR